MDTKICTQCGAEKSVGEFFQDRGYIKSECKKCTMARHKRWRDARKHVAISEKKCTKCLLTKSIAEFTRGAGNKDGYHGWCNECRKEWAHKRLEKDPDIHKRAYQRRKATGAARDQQLRQNFGITLIQYNEMLAVQNGGCAICSKGPGKKSLAVDHCHKTGKIRGLLCGGCNKALGHVEDDIERLKKLIEYLGKHLVVYEF